MLTSILRDLFLMKPGDTDTVDSPGGGTVRNNMEKSVFVHHTKLASRPSRELRSVTRPTTGAVLSASARQQNRCIASFGSLRSSNTLLFEISSTPGVLTLLNLEEWNARGTGSASMIRPDLAGWTMRRAPGRAIQDRHPKSLSLVRQAADKHHIGRRGSILRPALGFVSEPKCSKRRIVCGDARMTAQS